MIDFSIAISSLNRLECLKKCLQSITDSLKNSKDYEIVIVDNSTRQEVKNYLNTLKDIKVVHNTGIGEYSNHNKKFEISSGKYIYHCCDNYLVNNPNGIDWLQDIREVFEAEKDAKIAVVMNEATSSKVVCLTGLVNWNNTPKLKIKDIEYSILGSPNTHVFPTAGWAYKKEYFKIVGNFDASKQVESNHMWQLIKKGYRFAVITNSATTGMIPRMHDGRKF